MKEVRKILTIEYHPYVESKKNDTYESMKQKQIKGIGEEETCSWKSGVGRYK